MALSRDLLRHLQLFFNTTAGWVVARRTREPNDAPPHLIEVPAHDRALYERLHRNRARSPWVTGLGYVLGVSLGGLRPPDQAVPPVHPAVLHVVVIGDFCCDMF
jgi:hypothetical protein